MRKFSRLIFWIPLLFFATPELNAQAQAIRGTVSDAENGSAISGGSILIKNSKRGQTVDSNGHFNILANGNDILIFSRIGYLTQEIPVNNRTVINVRLKAEDKNLNEVVVVGYSSVIKKAVTGSIASIKTKDLENIPTSSLLNVLAGKAPGVQAIVRTGLPGGAGGGLVVRGNTNLSDASDVTGLSNPLYIVDGVPVSLEDLAGFDVTQNDFFATLNPDDIQSLDILKDAAATAIYGSRGANGVVIIKTKRGGNRKTRFNIGSSTGINFEPTKLKVFIGQAERDEKLRLYNESFKSLFGEQAWVDVRNGLEVKGYMLPAVLTDKYNPAFNNAYDYQKMFYQPGVTQQYNLSMDGGNEKNAFRTSLGYYKEKGVLVGFGFNRVTMNSSLTTEISKKLHNDLSLRLSYLTRQGGQSDNLRSFPTSPTDLPSSLFYKTPEELSLLSGKLGNTYNNNKTYQGSLSEVLRIDLAPGLTLDNQGSVSGTFGKKEYFVPSTATDNGLSYAESSNSGNFTLNAHSFLSYNKRFNQHDITALLGSEVNMDQESMSLLYGEGGPSDYIRVVQGFKKENVNGYSDIVQSNLLSYFGNVSYGYKDRYKIEAVLRRDASSRFGENNKWATFPSVKSYWVFSEEPFLKPLKNVLSFGKFRVSYGASGSIAADPLLQYNSFISNTNIGAGIHNIYANKIDVKTYGGVGALLADFNKIANKSLSWSKSKEVDYGIDLEFFNHRIYVTGDIYSRYTSGSVFVSELPSQVGYNSIRSNLVDMISNGWEFGVTGYLFPRTSPFQWDMTLNFSKNSTSIAKLGNGGRDYITGNYAFVVGQPAFQYYTYEYLGPLQSIDDLPVNPMTGERMKYYGADAGLAINQQGKIFPGMPMFTDVNGDYLIDGADYGNDKKIIQGKSPEPKIQGGFQTNIKYKNLNLRVQSSFAFGNYIFNTSLQQVLSQYDDNTAFFTKALYDLSGSINFWQKPGDNAYYPMRYISYSDGGSARSFRASSMFLEKGDYWSVDDITLSYNIPQKWSEHIGFTRVNVFSTVRNAYMWKASNVPDPRMVTKTGYYNGQGYPINRSLVVGLNVQL
jgi:TonB-linked SusC/RagA family outer membrane protein